MFIPFDKSDDKLQFYSQLNEQASALLLKSDPLITTLSNAVALLNYSLKDINWVGFYLFDGNHLYLGPFNGLPACTSIELGSGVCGTAATSRKLQNIGDVAQFEGHITCDSASASEIVIPIVKEEELIGVLDIDSPTKNRFDLQDEKGLKDFISILIDKIE
jgi:L-methionine (R)-S-oxide reductase